MKREIETLLVRKKAGDELNLEPRIAIINDFLEEEIRHLEAFLQNIEKSQVVEEQVFNKIFRDALAEVWDCK